jgi:alpha-L-rhamnosidase
VICPWVIWKTYGDTRVIQDHYAAIQRNLALLEKTSKNYLRLGQPGNGDWLNLGGGATLDVIGTAYDAYDFRVASEMAAAIGKDGDAATYRDRAERIAEAFVKAFVDDEGHIEGSSQTGFALAYTMGLVPDSLREKMGARFADEIQRFKGSVATGFIGTPRLLPALHLAGRDDLAYHVLLNETYPSWLFEVKNGATTMWEHWDSWTPEKGFAGSGMNSFNHYAFGSVGQYLYSVVGGIQTDSPGYGTFSIRPVLGEGLTYANTTFDSPHGRIVSHWKREGGRVLFDVSVPVNTTAEVAVPAADAASVLESGSPAALALGVKFLRLQNNAAVYEVASGDYHFSVADLIPAEHK